VTGVREGTDAAGGTARAVKSAAATLGGEAGRLRGEVDNFLARIRAA
jgi:hypothetical protein